MARKPAIVEETIPVSKLPPAISALVQVTEQLDQELTAANKKVIALVMVAKEEEELAAAYIRSYRAIRDLEDVLVEQLKEVKKVTEEFKNVKLPQAFDDANIKTMTLDTGDRVSLQERVVAGIRADKREEAIKWAKSSKKTRPLVQETINASTLGAYAKTLLEANESLPDELFNVNVLTQASLTKGKKK